MRSESSAFLLHYFSLASFIVIVCERFPGRVRTILTSRGDKTDGKIRRCRSNKGECLETGVEWWTARASSSSPFLSPSSNCMQPWGSHTIFRWSRTGREKVDDLPHIYMPIYIYIYVRCRGESTWYYEREEESRNRKRFTPTRTLPIVPCRVSKRETDGIPPVCFIQPRVSGTINTRAFPIVQFRVLDIYEYPLTRRKSDGSERLIVVPHGDGIRSIVGSE